MSLDIPGIQVPRLVKGSTGQYWEYAHGENCSLFLKFKYEQTTVVSENKPHDVAVLQVNLLFFGQQFDIPEPFKYVETRAYPVDGKKTEGHVVGKLWVPLGAFDENYPAMNEYVAKHVVGPLEEQMKPVLDACKTETLMPLAQLWQLMTENLDENKLRLPPQVLVGQQFHDFVAEHKSKIKSKYEKASEANDDSQEAE